MRVADLLLGLCLAVPALAAARADSACNGMLMPPERLREVSRGFGHGHTGLDLMAPLGSPIRAAAAGTVLYAGWYYDYGNIVDIRHSDGLITRYAHMSAFAPGISPGAPVAEGAVIGRVGMTGRAHGPHVHFEVRVDGRAVDPKPYLALAPCRQPAREPLEEARAPDDGRRDR
jgi:murein DD-endopeptidase MepM/ murein hydrolase activator NlpD